MLKQLFVSMALALMVGAPALAQDSTKVETSASGHVQMRPLADVVGPDHRASLSVLSPDGTMVAWVGKDDNKGICLLTIATATTECTPPDVAAGKSPSDLAWSPDSRTIAYSDNFFIYLLEADIHLFDVQQHAYRDITDDHSIASPLKPDPNAPEDYLPTWSADGTLYFWRSFAPQDGPTLSLEHFATPDSQPEAVGNYSHLVPGRYAISYAPAISPDRTMMAVIVLQSDLKAPENGIYTINLKTGESRLIATVNQLRFGLPDWIQQPSAYPMAIYWAGSNLVVNLYSPQFGKAEPSYAMYITLASKKVTPIFDFSAYKSAAEIVSAIDGGQPDGTPISLPGAGIPTSDGKQYLFVHRIDQDTVGLDSLPLPPDGSPAIQLATSANRPSPAARANTISSDGKRALIFDYLVTIGSS